MTLTPSRSVFGVTLPGLVAVAVGLGGVTSGCTREETTEGRIQPSERSAGLAPLEAAYTRDAVRADTHASRDIAAPSSRASKAAQTFFVGRSNPANTPLEMLLGDGDRPLLNNGLCPPDMASIDDRYCVDRYEASLLEVLPNGEERPFSSYDPLDGHTVRAVSEVDAFPRGYISAVQAGEACARSGKRLCKPAEWRNACMGPKHLTYGYSAANEPGRCNDHGRSPMGVLYSGENLGRRERWDAVHMNAPALNQVEGTLARAGSHSGCTNDYGVYDMVGNLHEWVADPDGTFQGGYYLDTKINGEGCSYKTTAHAASYHDYSTGFRCCADVAQ
jgi:formylglycine-generating enzyme